MKIFTRRNSIALGMVLVVVIAFGTGAFYGSTRAASSSMSSLAQSSVPVDEKINFDPFWKAWDVLNKKFVSSHKTDVKPQDKVWGAIEGLASSYGDPYTVFMPPEEAKLFETEISGNFEGVGMEIDIRDSIITVVSPLKGSPAEKAGVRSGDKVLKIDDKVTTGLKVEEAVKLIRGKKGTTVHLTILREGIRAPLEINIVRDVIKFPTLDSELRPDGIYVIKLYNFSAISPQLFEEAINKFRALQEQGKSNRLVLDLRGNPGGFLNAAQEMASFFLPKDAIVVREDYGGNSPEDSLRSYGYNVFPSSVKMVILINGGSASASEILAGALSEHGVATLVGEKSFGKGSVQELVKITSDTSLKVTIARWLTPKGNSISEKGIMPDVVVKMTPEDFEKKKDPQMDKAVEILLKK